MAQRLKRPNERYCRNNNYCKMAVWDYTISAAQEAMVMNRLRQGGLAKRI
jgi:hypothetical protein